MAFDTLQARRTARGFTLLEALVATLIVSLALVAMTQKVSQAIKVAKRTQEGTFARWVAMNAITELRLKPGLPDTGRSDGDEEMVGTVWRWNMDITPHPALEDVRQVDITVAYGDSPDVPLFGMTAFVGNNVPATNLRPWSGWPDAEAGSGRVAPTPTLRPGAPVQPDPRRGLDRSR